MNVLVFSFVLTSCLFDNLSAYLDLQKEFDRYIVKYKKPYKRESEEYRVRYENFKRNFEIQSYLNETQEVKSAQYGVTKFSDLSQDEFKALYLTDISRKVHQRHRLSTTPLFKIRNPSIPLKVDWRNHNNNSFVSPVKNQNKCGACWAFASVETVESMYAIKTGQKLPLLSVQEVIDCADHNAGCNGGTTCNAFQWMRDSQTPIVSERMYPLTDTSDYCTIFPNGTAGVFVKNYTCDSFVSKENQMLWLLANVGPLTVAVDATTWNYYMGGIIQYHCNIRENHAVQIIGYDISGDIPYYIVKNSWGSDFGINGYLHIKIGGNLCGIAQTVSTVDVSKSTMNLNILKYT